MKADGIAAWMELERPDGQLVDEKNPIETEIVLEPEQAFSHGQKET